MKNTILSLISTIDQLTAYCDNGRDLTITVENFLGFDEDWDEILVPVSDEVWNFINWMKENAFIVDGREFIFGGCNVTLEWASDEI